MIKIRKVRWKSRCLVLLSILCCLALSSVLLNFDNDTYASIENSNDEFENKIKNPNIKTQTLSSNNIYSGVGTPWNVSHWANRTDYNIPVDFENGTTYTVDMDLGMGWEGYQLSGTIKDLYDKRNWVNGTFEAGNDDNNDVSGDNDDYKLVNWTFHEDDIIGDHDNVFSGNYFDSASAPSGVSSNCIELRMDGENTGFNSWGYDKFDKCWWETIFTLPRGNIKEGEINLVMYPWTQYNHVGGGTGEYGTHWSIQIIINGVLIDDKNLVWIELTGNNGWAPLKLQLTNWLDDPVVFPTGVKNMNLTLQLIRNGGSLAYNDYGSYQQVLIDNVTINLKGEVNATQIGLQMNEQPVSDIDWGNGIVEHMSSWTETPVEVKFNSTETRPFEMGGYEVEFNTDINLFARKRNDNSDYKPNFDGTYFFGSNNSFVEWESYARISVPTGYEETNMTIVFPEDVNITYISNAEYPDTNILKYCDNSTLGILKVFNFSETPDGFWWIKGKSPNYCNNLEIYNNVTGSWELNNTFLSGHYINITGDVGNTVGALDISNYIVNTKARLQIRFPNGSIWTDATQFKSPDSNGVVDFGYFQIPSTPPNYEVGEYEIIITWNNSYSSFGVNETGIITKKFTVIHFSKITPDPSYYSNIFEGDTINLIVSFNDKENGNAIRNALVYVDNFTGGREYFNEINPGFYVLLDFNTSEGVAGDNLLTIYANSSLYQNNSTLITINLIVKTELTAQEFPYIQVPWNENFTIHLNYTEITTGNGITTSPKSNWLGEFSTTMTLPGIYNMQFNSSLYEVNKIHSLIIEVNETNYESQDILIKVEIIERETYIDNVFLNGIEKLTEKSITLTSGVLLNISFSYKDQISGDFLSGATARVVGGGISENINESLTYRQYEIVFNTSLLQIGATFLTVSAQLQNYSSSATVLTIYLGERGTSLVVLLNGAIYPDNYITVEVTQQINITVMYTDFLTGTYLDNATIELLDYGNFDEDPSLKQYNYTVDANILGQGIDILNIIATKSNYETQPAQITVEITKRITDLQLFFDGVNKTGDPFLELPIGSSLNISVRYLDKFSNFIDDADIKLLGEGLSESLNQIIDLDQYSILVDTRQLDIGISLLTIVAQRNNYQLQTINIRLDVQRIKTNITTLSGVTITNIDPGDSIDLKIKLDNLDFGGLILNASLSYRWQYGQGVLTDNNNDGIYESTISDIPEGSFTITITAFAGDDYDFERYEIFVTAVARTREDSIFPILFVIAIIGAVVLGSYFIAYQRYLKYPKPVRKVRKYRKKLKRKSAPSIHIISREKAFKEMYKEEFDKVQKLKITPAESIKKIEKPITKEPIYIPE